MNHLLHQPEWMMDIIDLVYDTHRTTHHSGNPSHLVCVRRFLEQSRGPRARCYSFQRLMLKPLDKEGEIAQMMLVVTELAEAVEGIRKDLMDDKVPARRAVEVELADALLRIAIIGEHQGYDIAGAALEKDAYNQTRPWRHGGKTL